MMKFRTLKSDRNQKFHHNRIIFHQDMPNAYHINGRPPSWVCDDVIILHPVMYGSSWSQHCLIFSRWMVCSFPANITYARQTDGHRYHSQRGAGLNKYTGSTLCSEKKHPLTFSFISSW